MQTSACRRSASADRTISRCHPEPLPSGSAASSGVGPRVSALAAAGDSLLDRDHAIALALHRRDYPCVAPWRGASHTLCYEWAHSPIAPAWGASALFAVFAVLGPLQPCPHAGATDQHRVEPAGRLVFAWRSSSAHLALIAQFACCSPGNVKEANHRPLSLVPRRDRLRCWQQLHMALLALEIVRGLR
jgi:hypothetical protein